jgi:hypothetical protein
MPDPAAPRLPRYTTLTAAQLRALTRLTDAARLLAAGLPAAYTTTPIGPLVRLADEASAVLLFLDPLPEAGPALDPERTAP